MTYQDVLNYWFSSRSKKHWFDSTPEIDSEIRGKFEDLYKSAAAGELNDWREKPESALALIIVLDQLPLNMYRGKAKCFSSENLSLECCHYALAEGYDNKMHEEELLFLLMPLGHSENLSDQNLHVQLVEKYTQSGEIKEADALRFAKHHRGLVKEFGRFPHRNAILGRESTPEELDYLASDRAFIG